MKHHYHLISVAPAAIVGSIRLAIRNQNHMGEESPSLWHEPVSLVDARLGQELAAGGWTVAVSYSPGARLRGSSTGCQVCRGIAGLIAANCEILSGYVPNFVTAFDIGDLVSALLG